MTKNTKGASMDHESGGAVYLRGGVEAKYVSALPDGRHVVVVTVTNMDGYGEEWSEDETRVVDTVYPSPPVEPVEKSVARLRSEEKRLLEAAREMRVRLDKEEAEANERLDALKKWSGFQTLEAFVSGRITHVVIAPGYGGPKIKTLDEALVCKDGSYRRKLRLVSLFGDSNGDTQWGINRYYDGSGSVEEIYPAESHDAAAAIVERLWEAGCDLVILACNTASAAALRRMQIRGHLKAIYEPLSAEAARS